MNTSVTRAIPLGRVAGIEVSVHWSWFLVAYFVIVQRVDQYSSLAWNALQYVALFGIVVLHEFGHAFACRSVGGKADRIVLWPLGGVALVSPPPRPGATLWSIAAGPLVNVLLIPVTIGAIALVNVTDTDQTNPDLAHFVNSLALANGALLVFNMLPIYPLDGGQILQSLLWFFLGRSRSLKVASVIGVLGGIAVLGLAVLWGSWILAAIGVFIAFAAWAGWKRAALLGQPGVEPLASGEAHLKSGDHARAVVDLTSALELLPPDPRLLAQVHTNRGLAYWRQGIYDRAVADYQEAMHLNPALTSAYNNLAWLRATCPAEEWRDGKEALAMAQKACELSNWQKPACLGTLAAAHAELGSFAEAATWQKKALEFPEYRQSDEEKARHRLREYEVGRPHRENLPTPSSLGAI